MRVRVEIDVDDDFRRALRARWGSGGLATAAQVRNEVLAVWSAHMEDIDYEYRPPVGKQGHLGTPLGDGL